MSSIPSKRWNIFARVLEDILIAHGYRLGHLDDRAKIHSEKVRRLKRSLEVPKSFPMLNPDEMKAVISIFQFNWQERIHLLAAVLATSVEATLMDRINQNDALMAAEQILPIIEGALQAHEGELSGLAATRKGVSIMSGEDTEIDSKLAGALSCIDQATLALHLSRSADDRRERTSYAKRALENFEAALAQLNIADYSLKGESAWQFWYDEAQSGLIAAKKRIATLGM